MRESEDMEREQGSAGARVLFKKAIGKFRSLATRTVRGSAVGEGGMRCDESVYTIVENWFRGFRKG